jgi:inner membrane protease ATP23
VDCPPGIEATSAESFTPSGELQAMIGICKNRKNLSFNRIGNEVTHELVHLYDNVRFDFDMNNCNQVLCTETRSALLSGQCQLLARNSIAPSSLPTLHLSSYQMENNGFQQCVSKRALTSTLKLAQCHGFGKLSDPHITNTIQVCMKDTSPFEVIP